MLSFNLNEMIPAMQDQFEILGNLLTQTNQTKQKFNRLYYLDGWIQII